MSRRPGYGFRANRRGIAHVVAGGGAPAFYPTDIASMIEVWDSVPASFTKSGSDITAWAGQKGAHTFTDLANPTQRPDNSATINGVNVVNFDGVAEWLQASTLDLPVPSTTPIAVWAVYEADTTANFEILFQGLGGASRAALQFTGAGNSGDMIMANTSLVNTNAAGAIATVHFVYALFTGSTSDILQIDGTAVTGASAGFVNPDAGVVIGSRMGAASTFFDGKIAALGVGNAALTAPQLTSLRQWAADTYGSVAP